MLAVGVDWAEKCWICVALDGSGAHVTSERTFGDVLSQFSGAAAVAVDIPIGLPKVSPGRRADETAARLVGSAKVFPTYPRAAYKCPTPAEAVARCRERGWPGISRQSYGLWQRMHEVEPHASKVCEVHPEVSFWMMNGESRLSASMHTWTASLNAAGCSHARA
jgi:predicted RNase H-like nuclease